MKRTIIMKNDEELHARFLEAAKAAYKPLTAWLRDAGIAALPAQKDSSHGTKPSAEKPVKLTTAEEKAVKKAAIKAQCLEIIKRQNKGFSPDDVAAIIGEDITGGTCEHYLRELEREGLAKSRFLPGTDDDEHFVTVFRFIDYVKDEPEPEIAPWGKGNKKDDDDVPFI